MIHRYVKNGLHFVLDVNSGAVHVLDELCYAVSGLIDADNTANKARLDRHALRLTSWNPRLLRVFTLLVGHRARGLAGGLAGSLAFAAAAVGRGLLQGGRGQRGYMLHDNSLLLFQMTVTLFLAHTGARQAAERRSGQRAEQADRNTYDMCRLVEQRGSCGQQDQKNQHPRAERPEESAAGGALCTLIC